MNVCVILHSPSLLLGCQFRYLIFDYIHFRLQFDLHFKLLLPVLLNLRISVLMPLQLGLTRTQLLTQLPDSLQITSCVENVFNCAQHACGIVKPCVNGCVIFSAIYLRCLLCQYFL